MVPVFQNVGERSMPKNYRPVSLHSVVIKVFENLLNNRLVKHLLLISLNVAFFLIPIMIIGILDQL